MPRLVLIVVALLAFAPAVALGHSGAGAASDYRTEPGPLVDASGAIIPGAEVDVIGGDDRLRLRWEGDGELIVVGYAGEPYLRLGPDGAFENAVSPSVASNRDRFGGLVDPEATVDDEPRWRRIADEPVAVWHDHRTHWMSESAPPPGVSEEPGREQVVQSWELRLQVDGRPATLGGELRYLPPPSPWPWLATALALALVSGALALRAPPSIARAAVRVAGVVAIGSAAALAVAEASSAPTTGLTDGLDGGLHPLAQAGLWAAAALLAILVWLRAARRGVGHEAVVILAAAWLLGGGAALARLGYLDSSVLPAPLPSPLSRALVTLALASLAAPTLWAWRSLAGVRSGARAGMEAGSGGVSDPRAGADRDLARGRPG